MPALGWESRHPAGSSLHLGESGEGDRVDVLERETAHGLGVQEDL